jgi:pimeloyl-ACP methyl ester carboxylesterase
MYIHTIQNKVSSENHIVFLHGNSSSSKVFRSAIDADLPYNMLAFDLPGHGLSEFSENISDYSFDNYKAVSLAQIKQLKGDVILVGNSLGGHIVIEIAEKVPNLKGIIIMGTAPVKSPLNLEEAITPNEALPVFMTENPSEENIIKAMEIGTYQKKTSQPSLNKLLVDDFQQTDGKIRTAIALDLSNDRLGNEYEILQQLHCPKIIIQGRQEPTVKALYLDEVATKSKANLVYLEACGHYPSIEQPEKFIQLIKDFSKACFTKVEHLQSTK